MPDMEYEENMETSISARKFADMDVNADLSWLVKLFEVAGEDAACVNWPAVVSHLEDKGYSEYGLSGWGTDCNTSDQYGRYLVGQCMRMFSGDESGMKVASAAS